MTGAIPAHFAVGPAPSSALTSPSWAGASPCMMIFCIGLQLRPCRNGLRARPRYKKGIQAPAFVNFRSLK